LDLLLFFIAEINENTRIQTLKRMLSVAKSLVENESNEIFELAHHIADNVLNKICMLIGIEKNKKNLVYYIHMIEIERQKTSMFYIGIFLKISFQMFQNIMI
jgi:hypothetical protein